MSDTKTHQLTKRCPVCFSREIDILLQTAGDDQFYCVKCSFTGSTSEISAMYRDIQKKYHWMSRRIPMEEQLNL